MAEQKIISIYEVRYDTKAPKIALAPKEIQSFMLFKGGTTINGYPMELQPGLTAVITEDNQFALPITALTKKRDLSIDGKKVEMSPEEAAKLTTLPQSIQDKFDAITKTDLVNKVITTAQQSSTGIIVGAIGGIIFGLAFKKSVVISAIVGAIGVGFLASKITLPTIEKTIE